MSSEIAIEAVEPAVLLDRLRADVVDVWATAHELPRASASRREFGRDRLPRHAAREGFRFRGAFDPAGRVVGFVYGYTGAQGQWWYDRVAAALSPAARGHWVDAEHFELTELAVRPDFQSLGVGSRLHDLVLDGLPQPRALLSALAENVRVRQFYEHRGWEVVLDGLRFEAGRPLFCIMGKELRAARR